MKKAISIMLTVMLSCVMLYGCGGSKSEDGAKQTEPPKTEDAKTGNSGKESASESKVYPENGLPTDQKVTLKYGFFESGTGTEYVKHAMDTFKKKFPNVDFDITISPDIATIINAKIAANNDDDMFDIFAQASTQGFDALVAAGKIEPQEDLWSKKLYDTPDKMLKDVANEGEFETARRINGLSYYLPVAGFNGGLYFDRKQFEKNNWNQDPKTWDEFMQLLADIKSKGINPITYPGQYPYYMDFTFSTKVFELAEANNHLDEFVNNFRGYKLPSYNSPENQELWSRIYDMGKKGYFPQGIGALSHTQAQMQVMQGKSAMASTGSWVGNEMKEATPEGFEWGYMAVPFTNNPDATVWIQHGAIAGELIWANKPDLNKKWAKEFLVWLWNMDVQELLAEKGGVIPARKDFADDPARAEKLQAAPKAFLDYVKNHKVRFENNYREVNLTDPAYQQAVKLFSESVTQITEGKKDPLPVLKEADSLLQKAWDNQK